MQAITTIGFGASQWDTGGKKPNDCMERLGVPLFAKWLK